MTFFNKNNNFVGDIALKHLLQTNVVLLVDERPHCVSFLWTFQEKIVPLTYAIFSTRWSHNMFSSNYITLWTKRRLNAQRLIGVCVDLLCVSWIIQMWHVNRQNWIENCQTCLSFHQRIVQYTQNSNRLLRKSVCSL